MKLLVYDVPALYGGALTVLKELYFYAKTKKEIQWCFVLNRDLRNDKSLVPVENIIIEYSSSVSGSWLKRVGYDYLKLPKVIRKYAPDVILSLANIKVPYYGIPQYIYMHNIIPFCNYSFSFWGQRKLWIYKNLIGKIIIRNLKTCEGVVVQTEWVKQAVIDKCRIKDDKIILCSPNIDLKGIKKFDPLGHDARKTFFYPANMSSFKNHEVIVRALKLLNEETAKDICVIFTGDVGSLKNNNIDKLPIKMVGRLDYESVLELYSKSVLIFPSKIETFGLPLAEARAAGSIILAGNTPFAHELLNGYPNVYFFDVDDEFALAKQIEMVKNGSDYTFGENAIPLKGSWDGVIQYINQDKEQ